MLKMWQRETGSPLFQTSAAPQAISKPRSIGLCFMRFTVVVISTFGFSTFAAASTKKMSSTMHHAVSIPKPATVSQRPTNKPSVAPSAFQQEASLNPRKLIDRWQPFIDQASKRVGVPSDWIKAVAEEESGGRTMLAPNVPITSSMGAMGIMQLMPQTWREMQQIYKLGPNPYDPHDNILAGAAYLRSLYWEYGYPGMFAAYNDGPDMIEAHRRLQQLLPAETSKYIIDIATILRTGSRVPTTLTAPANVYVTPSGSENTLNPPVPAPAYPQDMDDDYYHED
jgi:hypothetical protein